LNKHAKDRYVLEQFIGIYCRGKHRTKPDLLCPECADLLAYAAERLERCPRQPKPSCKHCPTHCYRPAYRDRIREVMRYSGKRLLLRGRLDLIRHYFL
jgi:predicted amidophosphoribosyltransferase